MLEDFKRSYAAYQRATECEPFNLLAWKGLLVLAERRKTVQTYLEATTGLITCYKQTNSIVNAVEALENARKFVRKNTTDQNEAAFLRLQLPGSPIFGYMEGRLPPPALTYAKLIQLEEKAEGKVLSKYQGKGMSRLTSKDSKATNDAVYEIFQNSKVCYFSRFMTLFLIK